MTREKARDTVLNVRVPSELKKRLERHASAQGKSLSRLLRDTLEALANILDHNDTKGPSEKP